MSKSRRHSICENAPLIAFLFLAAVSFIWSSAFEAIMLSAVGPLLPSIRPDILGDILAIIGSLILLLLVKLWFSPDFKGFFKCRLEGRSVFLICLPYLIYIGASLVDFLMKSNFYYDLSLKNLTQALNAGISEETMFRAVTLAVGMRYFKSNNRIWNLILISAIPFGLMHMLNITAGATFENGIIQAVSASFTGIFLAALYLTTGSILLPMLLHSLNDYVCFTFDPGLTGGIMTAALPKQTVIFEAVFCVIFLITAITAVQKIGRGRIFQIWRQAWSQQENSVNTYEPQPAAASEKVMHSFTAKHPYLSSVLMAAGNLFALQFIKLIIDTGINQLVPSYSIENGPAGLIIGAVILLLFYKHWFRDEFTGFIRGNASRHLSSAILIYILFWTISVVYGITIEKETFIMPGMHYILIALSAGVTEELVFRGILLTTLMRKADNRQSVVRVLIFSSLVFGLIHGTNIFMGADPVRTVLQVVSATVMGILLGYVYLLSGNILIPMVLHTIHDMIAFSFPSDLSESGVIVAGASAGDFISTGITFIPLILLLAVLKPDAYTDIIDIWKKKWIIGGTN